MIVRFSVNGFFIDGIVVTEVLTKFSAYYKVKTSRKEVQYFDKKYCTIIDAKEATYGKVKTFLTNDLKDCKAEKLLHEGRLVFVGTKMRKRFIYKGKFGGLYVKSIPSGKAKHYISQGGRFVITSIVKSLSYD